MKTTALIFNYLLSLTLLLAPTPRLAAQSLQPGQIAIIVNSALPESVQTGEYYCRQRGIDPGRIIALDLPVSEQIAWQVWQETIAPALRQRLLAEEMNGVRCLVTVYGVPLRINGYTPQGDELEKRKLIDQLIQKYYGELNELPDDFKAINPVATIIKPKTGEPFAMPGYWVKRDQRAAEMVKATDEAMWTAQRTVKALVDKETAALKMKEFEALFERYMGLEGQLSAVATLIQQQPARPDLDAFKLEYQKGMARLKLQAEEVAQLAREPFQRDNWLKRYELLGQAAGLKGICRFLLADRKAIGDEDSESAFDSELTLLLWDNYTPGGYLDNPLNQKAAAPSGQANTKPTLMVARLDGPTPEIARGLVDKALAAEAKPLSGTVYLDARGITSDIASYGSYGFFDENLRQTAAQLKTTTALPVVLDNRAALFGPSQCPNTVLYCGWYSLRAYIDSFTFAPGAVGYHIASFEAETLRRQEPDTGQWCKRLLEKGITATLGAVAEPYLHTFPPPDRFFADLVSGQHTLAEVFFRNLPYNSWRVILIGDPLFRGRYPLKP